MSQQEQVGAWVDAGTGLEDEATGHLFPARRQRETGGAVGDGHGVGAGHQPQRLGRRSEGPQPGQHPEDEHRPEDQDTLPSSRQIHPAAATAATPSRSGIEETRLAIVAVTR